MKKIATVTSCGQLATTNLAEILREDEVDLALAIYDIFKKDTTGEFKAIIRKVLNEISDDEIEKVLKN